MYLISWIGYKSFFTVKIGPLISGRKEFFFAMPSRLDDEGYGFLRTLRLSGAPREIFGRSSSRRNHKHAASRSRAPALSLLANALLVCHALPPRACARKHGWAQAWVGASAQLLHLLFWVRGVRREMRHGTARCGAVRHSAAWRGVARRGVVCQSALIGTGLSAAADGGGGPSPLSRLLSTGDVISGQKPPMQHCLSRSANQNMAAEMHGLHSRGSK